ncbi:MAG TPA: hypothetical protein ENI82_03655 [Bacteroidetes bacterium]|nr:hypothetical protein [Bacteroidota bacterium]
MNYGICQLSTIALRSTAFHKSEMISQILFGETVEILVKKGAWLKVRCTWDNYIGWIDAKQIHLISEADFDYFEENYAYSFALVQPAAAEEFFLSITIGARLPDFDGLQFKLANTQYTFSGQAVFPVDIKASSELIVKLARKYLHAPYLWGGRSPMGIDCSGLSQMIYKIAGINIPRDADQQVGVGELVDFMEESRPGDLAFFENKKGRISHVGIIISENEIIHSHGKVRIDKLDHYGIFNTRSKKYTHRLRVIKRMLPFNPTQKIQKILEVETEPNQVELF